MTYALIVFANPTIDNQNEWQQWQNILNSLENARNNNADIEKIHENVWLLPLQNELPLLARILNDSNHAEINQYVSFFEKKPLFITS